MTDIEKKALALVNEVETERGMSEWTDVCRSELTMGEALCRAIEQHEAFRQEVSEALQWYWKYADTVPTNFEHFIIAKPVDPLVAALASIDISLSDHELQKLKDMGVGVTAPARGEG